MQGMVKNRKKKSGEGREDQEMERIRRRKVKKKVEGERFIE